MKAGFSVSEPDKRETVFRVDEPAMKSETVFRVAKLAQMNLNFVFSNLPIQTLILVFNL